MEIIATDKLDAPLNSMQKNCKKSILDYWIISWKKIKDTFQDDMKVNF